MESHKATKRWLSVDDPTFPAFKFPALQFFGFIFFVRKFI
jgi:hypothetical protein